MHHPRRIAYFCMEVGYQASMPTYTGGLGILAGDTLRSAADLHLPVVAVTLLHRKGYFRQVLDAWGGQSEEPERWAVADFLKETSARATVTIEGRTVHLRAWQFDVKGYAGFHVPVYFLDSALDENTEADRALTDHLYGGDTRYRLCQEIILGVGGVRILRALGWRTLERYHMNEGHAALLAAELLDERLRAENRHDPSPNDLEAVRKQCIFTTHTPVPAGHDEFPSEQAASVIEPRLCHVLGRIGCLDGSLNMTHLALKLSSYVNAVSRRHGEVSRKMFAGQHVDAITNGVHARTWVSPRIAELFDRYLPLWREETFTLRQAMRIPNHELWGAHVHAKILLLDYVNRTTGLVLDPQAFTIGFARRMAAYKRADLFLDDVARLKRIHGVTGGIQIIYAGKAHPRDTGAKEILRHVFRAREALLPDIKLAFLTNYDMHVASRLVSGVDLWLNTPEPPMEASGTSGMKAAMNGVPSLSVLDGWWVEGCIENVTGWAIGRDGDGRDAVDRAATAEMIYDKLEHVILPMYYHDRDRFIDIMRHAIAVNGSYFSTQRMVHQYATRAYFR